MTQSAGPPYLSRLVDRWLDEYMDELPAFLLVGPRAAGKTTTAVRRAASIIRLDRPAEARVLAADPDAVLRGLPEPVVIDEWQEVPDVLGAVKRSVDARPSPGRYLVTGSVRASLTEQTWPGTGRLVRFAVYPMTVREKLGIPGDMTFLDRFLDGAPFVFENPPPDLRGYVGLALAGGFPYPVLELGSGAREAWLESYIDDLINRDVPTLETQVTRAREPAKLRRYFDAYAASSASVVSDRTIQEAAGINHVTAGAYEDLLERLYAISRVPAWRSNRLKRLVARPKRYLVDSGLLAAALGVNEEAALKDGDVLGRILDTFVVAQLRPELALSHRRPKLYHLRTKGGEHEIDLLLELRDGNVVGIEIKASAAPRESDARHLRWLRDRLGDRFAGGIVFHTGPHPFELDNAIHALPIATLWSGDAADRR